MRDRLMLFRPLSGQCLHPDMDWKEGNNTQKLTTYGDLSFTVDAAWHKQVAKDGADYFIKRGTIAVVVRPDDSIRQAGLVIDFTPGEDLQVICAGHSSIAAGSGPWEGHQGYFLTMDPVQLFRRIWEQTQSYDNANLGIRITGDTNSGAAVGDPGSRAWQETERALRQARPQLDLWEGRQVNRERELSRRMETMFRAAGLKRVGNITESENAPDDPGYQADSSLWVRPSDERAFRWVDDRWLGQDAANSTVSSWYEMKRLAEFAKAEVDMYRYQVEPLEERLEELEGEAREEYGLYFWQNHDMGTVIEELTELGPFEYREHANLVATPLGLPALDLQIEVGAPRAGVRRPEIRLELGVNIQDHPVVEHGDMYTGVTLFGAGEGSEVLSEQRSWDPEHVVRNIRTETDKDAHTRELTRNAANALLDEVKADAGLRFARLTVHHTQKVPEGSIRVGDEYFIAGTLRDGTVADQWVRATEVQHAWGSKTTDIGVEPV